jgi:NADH-quinone oxidoreductase subunit B
VADKGFLVTSTEDLFTWARTGSLWWMTVRPRLLRGRDDPRQHAALRSGAFRRRAARSPRQSDVMIVAGTLCNKMAPALRRVYDQMSSRATSSRWARAPMAAAIIITATAWCAAATGSCRRHLCARLPADRRGSAYGIMQLQRKIRRVGTIER